jgi:hypothetical protein
VSLLLVPFRIAGVLAHLAADYAFARWDESVMRKHSPSWIMEEWKAAEERSSSSPYQLPTDRP